MEISASILVTTDERDPMNSKNKTRTIKELTAANRELKKTLSGVRGQLTKTETKLTKANQKVDRWKKETAAQRTAASPRRPGGKAAEEVGPRSGCPGAGPGRRSAGGSCLRPSGG